MDQRDSDSAISVPTDGHGPLKEGGPPTEGPAPATGHTPLPAMADTEAVSEPQAVTSKAPSDPTANPSPAQHAPTPAATLAAEPPLSSRSASRETDVPTSSMASAEIPQSGLSEGQTPSTPLPGRRPDRIVHGGVEEDDPAAVAAEEADREAADLQELEDLEAAEQAEDGASIVVDQDDLGRDDGYESDTHTAASTSLASSVRDYAFENGRRYHKFREGRYNFPNDDVEQEREDMKHAMVKLLCQQLHFAPIGDNPQQILDIGTGTAIWAIESECNSCCLSGKRVLIRVPYR